MFYFLLTRDFFKRTLHFSANTLFCHFQFCLLSLWFLQYCFWKGVLLIPPAFNGASQDKYQRKVIWMCCCQSKFTRKVGINVLIATRRFRTRKPWKKIYERCIRTKSHTNVHVKWSLHILLIGNISANMIKTKRGRMRNR